MDNDINIHPTALDEPEAVIMDEFLQDVAWQNVDIDGNWLDPSEAYRRPRFTLSYNGVPFAPLGGIHGLTGQPGHGKTFTFTQLMVAILKGDFYGLHYELKKDIPDPKVLYIDTEMEKGNTQLVMLRVYELMGWDPGTVHEEFKILWLREEVKSEDRWRKTLKAISIMKPTVVFLDGLIDVIGDFNDNKECQNIIYQCMATASHYGISMWCLLHENPGTTKMVGHAGSFLERKATDVLKCRKDKSSTSVTFTVSQNKARARDLSDWIFYIESGDNDYGRPVIKGSEEEDISTSNKYSLEEYISVIGTDKLSMRSLRERIKDRFHIGSTKATDFINEATLKGLLTCENSKYRLNNSNLLDDMSEENPF